jgi:hypothetical protein
MGTVVRTWADHLAPIDATPYGSAEIIGRWDFFVPGSQNLMTKEYVNTEGKPVTWFTAEDGSLFFYPFGRVTGFYLNLGDGPFDYLMHQMFLGDRPNTSPGTEFIFGFVYLIDSDFSEMIGQNVTCENAGFTITEEGRLDAGSGGQLLTPPEEGYGDIVSCQKLAPVT